MANTDVTPKKSWFEGLKAEFRKIIWPNRQDLVKQTTAVVVVSVVLGNHYCSSGLCGSEWY